jgi:two-component system, cell cycle sensor histidine kinase and response regulator CckA
MPRKSPTFELPTNEVRDPSAVTAPPLRGRKHMQYRALPEAAPDAIVVVNQSGTIVLVNAQAEILFGYRRAELIGQPAEILVSEHSRSQHSEQHSRFLAAPPEHPTAVGLELFGLRKDGCEFPAEIRLSPLDAEQGTLVSSAIRDISGRRRTEEDLRRLASIVTCSDDAIIGKTLEGIITSWNAGAERVYGYSAKEAIGKPVSMLVPIDRPDEIPKVLDRLKRGEIIDHFETVRVNKNGKEIQVEITASPIRDAMERIVGASTIAHDISERKRREYDLCRLAAIVESSRDAIISVTSEGGILTWNHGAERIFGYSADEAVGRSILFLSPPDRPVKDSTLLQRIERADIIENFETIRVKKDGTRIHVAITLSPIKDPDGQVVGVSSIFRDVTESKCLEDMFRQAQKMEAVGQLAGGVAHDFNNLLGVILGYTGLMLDRLSPDDPERKNIEQIEKAGDRAALLTRQLLAFSREQVLQPKVLGLNTVVTGMEKLVQRLIGEHIELLVVIDPSLGRVKADSGQIEQIIMNLVVNARDAMPTGGKLTIETSNVELDEDYAARHASTVPGPHVMLAVTDIGCGMDSKTQARIFEPFFTTKEFGKGTGLGLSTVYGVVKQSGGSVWVYSELGIGTTFKIYLPCVDSALETEPPTETMKRIDRGSKTILIVEDDAALLQVTGQSLQEAGYTILAAQSPAEAIHISESHPGPIHLMVTDVIMPGMSGSQLATHLSPLRTEMKVLYVSGYTDDTIVHHGFLESGLAFLQKPFSPKMLARKVGEVLATT